MGRALVANTAVLRRLVDKCFAYITPEVQVISVFASLSRIKMPDTSLLLNYRVLDKSCCRPIVHDTNDTGQQYKESKNGYDSNGWHACLHAKNGEYETHVTQSNYPDQELLPVEGASKSSSPFVFLQLHPKAEVQSASRQDHF